MKIDGEVPLKEIVEDYKDKILKSKTKEIAENFANECTTNIAAILNDELKRQSQTAK